MKRHITAALIAGLVMGLAGSAHAAFSSISRSTNTAVAGLTGAGTVSFDIVLKKLSDNSTTTQVYWSGVTLPASYETAASYIQVNSTMTTGGGGLQVYTDNRAADASPSFTYPNGAKIYTSSGTAGTNPAGLIDTSTTTKRLVMAWSIKDTTSTAPAAGDPTDTNNFSNWLFMKDRGTLDISSENTTKFTDGEAFVTVKRNVDSGSSGIHFGQSDTEFGGADSPDYLYFQADFRTAVTPREYKTSTLRLEAYTQ